MTVIGGRKDNNAGMECFQVWDESLDDDFGGDNNLKIVLN